MNTQVWFAPPWLWLAADAAIPGPYTLGLAGAGAFAAILLVTTWVWRRAGALAAAAILVLAELSRLTLTLPPAGLSALLPAAAATAASYAAVAWLVARDDTAGAVAPARRGQATRTVLRCNAVILGLTTVACAAAALVFDAPHPADAAARIAQALGLWCTALNLLLAGLGVAALLRPRPTPDFAARPRADAPPLSQLRITGLVLLLAYGASLVADGAAAVHPGSGFSMWAALAAAGARMLLLPGLVLLLAPGATYGGFPFRATAALSGVAALSQAPGQAQPHSQSGAPGAGPTDDTGPGAGVPGFVQVEQRLAALAEALQQQAQRLSLMSHELRAPVSTISAATHSLEIVLAGTDPQVEARLQRIGRAVARMGELMEQMLGQERVYDQALAPRCTQVDLAALAGEVIGTLRDEAAHTLRLRLPDARDAQAPAARLSAYCDGPLTGVVLRNLIHNAIKYSPANQPIDIEIGITDTAGTADSSAPRAWIAVQDHGPGIGAEDLDRIFDPHFRRAAHRETTGLGLGLHLVRRICERQGGTLTVASQPGQGARFVITLPVWSPYQAAKT